MTPERSPRVSGYLQSVESKLRESELANVDAQVRAEELRRRQKLSVVAGTGIALSLIVGLAASVWQGRRADYEAAQATQAARQALKQEQRALEALDELRATAPAFAEQARSLRPTRSFARRSRSSTTVLPHGEPLLQRLLGRDRESTENTEERCRLG